MRKPIQLLRTGADRVGHDPQAGIRDKRDQSKNQCVFNQFLAFLTANHFSNFTYNPRSMVFICFLSVF
jgi:hypothetical protein